MHSIPANYKRRLLRRLLVAAILGALADDAMHAYSQPPSARGEYPVQQAVVLVPQPTAAMTDRHALRRPPYAGPPMAQRIDTTRPVGANPIAMQSYYSQTPSRQDPLPPPQALPPGSENFGNRTASRGASGFKLGAAPLEPTDVPLAINLASILQLSDGRPLNVTAAQAKAWVAEARYQRAKLIKIPEFDFGVCYVRHDGFGPDFNHGANEPTFVPGVGGPLNQNLNFIYLGGSVFGVIPLTDAIFQPMAARQQLNSKRFDIQAARNDAMLNAAHAYFNVHQQRGQYAAAVEVVSRGEQLLARVTHLSHDLVPKVEIDRAVNLLANLQRNAALARQQWRVESANLTQILRLDPRVIIIPLESDQLQITLIDPSRSLDELMNIALNYRPELASQRATIQAAEATVRQEKNRPLLPTLYVTGFQTPGNMRMQVEVFGLGRGSKMNNWSLREDVSLQAIWTFEGFGLGNLAKIKKARGMQSDSIVDYRRGQDTVVAEVTRAQADLQSAAVRVIEAERALQSALVTYEGNFEGLAQTRRFENVLVQVYRPQEAVAALERLLDSYNQYFLTVADYNRAQFELFHALGYPSRELSLLRPPGEVMPADTNRPNYLPPVGIGPPPANR